MIVRAASPSVLAERLAIRRPAAWRGPKRPAGDTSIGESGFTLIEVLVALALLAVLGAMMAGFLGQLRPLTALQSRTAHEAELSAVLRYMEDTLSGALPLPLVASGDENHLFLRGNPAEVSFVAHVRQGTRAFALRETSFLLRSSGGRKELVQTTRLRRLADEAHDEESYLILRDVVEFRLSYLGGVSDGNRPVWRESWTQEATLPSAVKIALTIERDGRELYAERIALLALSAERS